MPSDLTPKEWDLLVLSATMSDPDIAAATGLKRQSVKNARQEIYQKLNVSGPRALCLALAEVGWLTVPGDLKVLGA